MTTISNLMGFNIILLNKLLILKDYTFTKTIISALVKYFDQFYSYKLHQLILYEDKAGSYIVKLRGKSEITLTV